MSTGYTDGDGALARLVCVGPPDAGGNAGRHSGVANPAGDPADMVPNILYGAQGNVATSGYNTVPALTMGVGDFSFEMWMKNILPSSWDTGSFYWGLFLSGTIAESIYLAPNWGAFGGVEAFYNPAGFVGYLSDPPDGWFHVAANFDRNVQLELYINGTLQGVSALPDIGAPTNWGAHDFYPGWHTAPWDDGDWPTVGMGPCAVHQVLLTPAQMLESVRRKHVQLLGTTMAAYDWRGLRGYTGWEFDRTLMAEGVDARAGNGLGTGALRNGFPASESPACPLGALGDVVVPDLSGNGNDITMWTLPAYTRWDTVPANLLYGRCAFGHDLFFR